MKARSVCVSPAAAAIVFGFLATAAPSWGGVINEDLKLVTDDPAGGFGGPVAIGNRVVAVKGFVVGRNDRRTPGALLFRASTGVPFGTLLPEGGGAFASSIAIADGVIAVGASEDDDNGIHSGSAYLFDAATGKQLFKLLPSDGAPWQVFGHSIAISNGVVAIGSAPFEDEREHPGSAYLFDVSNGEQLLKLVPSDSEPGDRFGWAIDIENGIVAIGTPVGDENGPASGAAYLFDAATGAQITKLLPGDGAEGDFFGGSVAIDNGVVAIGAVFDDDNGLSSGSAYLFDAITGAQIAKLLPIDGAAGDEFGRSIAIENGVVAVGASEDDENGTNSGSAYLFDASTGEQLAKLLPSDGAEGDRFGGSVAIESGTIAASSPGNRSAYVFFLVGGECVRDPEWQCDGDVDGDGQVNPVDAGLVQASFGSVDEQDVCNYDVDCDGQINPVDAGIVQSLFGTCDAPRAACP